MRQVNTAKQLVDDPVGHYLAGGSFVIWVQSAARLGMFHTAVTLDRADQPSLVEAFQLPTSARLAPRYDLLHDVASVDHFDESAFVFFDAFLVQWVDAIAQRARRLAVVRPHGIAGAAFIGLFQKWVVPRFDARLCTTRGEAYDFLDVPADDRRTLDALSDDVAPILRRLRDHLMANVVTTTLERAAGELGVGARSLQRALGEAGTSFRDELALVRIHLAENRLLDSDDKLDVIAKQLGFGSSPAFIRMFERATGISPGEFRHRGRHPS